MSAIAVVSVHAVVSLLVQQGQISCDGGYIDQWSHTSAVTMTYTKTLSMQLAKSWGIL